MTHILTVTFDGNDHTVSELTAKIQKWQEMQGHNIHIFQAVIDGMPFLNDKGAF
jgi:hypothetical protein